MTTKTTKSKSDAFEAIHSAAKGLHGAGAISKTTMREYDALCLDTRRNRVSATHIIESCGYRPAACNK